MNSGIGSWIKSRIKGSIKHGDNSGDNRGDNQEKTNNNIVKPNIDKTEQQSQQQQNKNTKQKHISSQTNDTVANIKVIFKHSSDEYGVDVDMLFDTNK